MVRAPQRDRLQRIHVPAWIGGMNTIAVGTDMPPGDSIYSYNLIGGQYGLRSRLGYSEWITNLDGDPRSILPFTGSLGDGSNNRLFVCTESGIWDCSASSQSPSQSVAFGIQNNDSGWGMSCAFTDLNGDHWLIYTDEANGYYVYSETTATWTKVTHGLGEFQVSEPFVEGGGGIAADPTKFVAVLPWKNRLWFVEKDTARAWYTGISSLFGEVNYFHFGSRFKYGGDLRCLASWSVRGAQSLDDLLVAVSGGGDVLIYQGTDPAQPATFGLQSVAFVGAVPAGRRLTTDFGSELLIMSSLGIIPASKLISGSILYDSTQYATAKIANYFNSLMQSTAGTRGWAMRLHPKDNCLMVLVPTTINQPAITLAMSLVTKGWHQFRDWPMGVCAEPWEGDLYFGSGDGSGRLFLNDGDVDGVELANPNNYSPITWSVLGAFSNLGRPTLKRIQLIQPRVLSSGGWELYQAAARYGFDFSEITQALLGGVGGAGTWDSGLWDSAVWQSDFQPQLQTFGAFGMGIEAAIAIRGKAKSRTTLVGTDVWFDEGTGLIGQGTPNGLGSL